MAELFEVDNSSVSRHLKNIFSEGELDEKVVVAIFATTTQHGTMAIAGQTAAKIIYTKADHNKDHMGLTEMPRIFSKKNPVKNISARVNQFIFFGSTYYIRKMPDYTVTLEAAWTIKDVETIEDAIGIAISEAGKRLLPSAKFVDVDVLSMPCPYCAKEINSSLVVAKTGLVGLLLSMKVFNAENENHAERIAKSVIGKALRDIPLATYSIVQTEEKP